MSGFVLSPQSQTDLDGIWDFTEQRWNAAQAESYIRELWNAIKFVAEDPRRGRKCDEIRPGYFKSRAGAHVIFYKLADGGIDVVRILHAGMDFQQHL